MLFLGCAVAALSGCGGCARQPSAATAEPRAADSLRRSAAQPQPAARILVMAAGRPVSGSAADIPPEQAPVPTVGYASLEAARDSIGAIVSRTIGGADTAFHVSRQAVTFDYIYAKAKAHGWALHFAVTDTSDCPMTAVQKAILAAGWVEDFDYMADGTDGSDEGFVCRNFFCYVEGRWDGGDDSDSTYVPKPGCELTVTCVPRREDDTPPR